MSDLNLAINLSAVDNASGVFRTLGGAIQNLASGNVVGAVAAVGTAVAGIGVQAVKMAGDYQQSLTSLVTGAGEAQSNIKLVSDGILQMAVDTGTSTKQLTDGMYMIESAGYHGANGLNVLKIAAEGARVGNADLGVTANALTTFLHDYGMSSTQASSAMNALITTVASGKTHLQDLAGAMGSILPLASSLGVSFPQVGGALATMTNAGMSAQQASQNLAAAIRALSNPSAGATKMLLTMGLSAQQLKDELSTQGLTGALQMVEDHVGKKFPAGSVEATHAFSTLLGGATGVKVALMLGGENMKTFEANVKSVSGAMKSGSSDVTGWALVQQDLNFQIARFQQIGETAMIKLGQALLPMVTGAFELLNNAMTGIGSSLQGFGNDVGTIFTYIGNVLKSLDLSDFSDAWTDVKASVTGLGQAFQALMGSASPLGALLGYLGSDFDTITPVIYALAHDGLQVLTTILWQVYVAISAVSTAIMGSDRPISDIGAAFKQVGAILGGQFKADLAWLGNTFNQIAGWVKTSLMPALATLIPPLQSIATTIITNFLPAFAQVYVSMQQLGQAIYTQLIGVLEMVIPPVILLAGFLAGALAAGFKIVAPLVGILADVISGLVTFFTKTEIGGDLVKATLILLAVPVSILALAFTALAVESIAAFIASVPAMVAGFLAGAAAAWTMAAGVLADTWPLLAIIAVIALVILAIQHWSDIVNWLKMVWGHIADFFVNLWNGIVDHAKQAGASISSWWSGVWGGISDNSKKAGNAISSWWSGVVDDAEKDGAAFSSWWSGVWDSIVSALKTAWDSIVNAVKIAGQALVAAIITAFNAIVASFVWLYNHNYYIKALVDAIVDFFKACIAWIEMAWTASVNWLVSVWNVIVKAATTAWNAVSNAVTGAVKVAWDWLVGAWNAVSSWLVGVWNVIAKAATTAWNAVSGAITAAAKVAWDWLVSAWTTASKWLQDAWNTVAKFATDLWTKIATAVHDQWVKAVDYVTSVWNQISAVFTSAWNNYIVKPLTALWTNVSNVFSSAWNSYVSKPLSDLWNSISKWFADLGAGALRSGQNFINMLVNGINAGTGAIWNAVVNIANTIWKALGFHSPAQAGPGSDADKWMPNLVSMLSDGLNSNAAKVQSASNNIAAGINNALGKLGPNARVWSADMMNNFVNGILAAVNATGNAVAQIANKIAAFLHFSKPDTGALAASDTWMTDFGNMLTSGLTNNVNNVQKAAASLASAMSSALSNTGTNAMNSATNFINMLVNGINSGVGSIWNAVVNIANTIWRALGFHSPAKAGPGADADKWMPNLTSMLSSSLTAGVPQMQAAVDALTKPLASLSPTNSSLGTNVDKWTSDLISKISNDLTAGVSKIQSAVNAMIQPLGSLSNGSAAPAAAAPQSTANTNTNATTIHVHLDGNSSADAQKRGKDIAEVVKKELAKGLRQQSVAPRYTSGGTHN